MKLAIGSLAVVLAMGLSGAVCGAQAQTPDEKARLMESKSESRPDSHGDPRGFKIFYLKNVNQESEANEILTAVRITLDPQAKVFLDGSQNAITERGTAEDFAITQRILDDLDRPKKVYRITYTINESDGGKRIGSQHFAMTAASGQRATLKQGSKVPIVTGSYAPGKTEQGSQMTYLDVGMNFDATLQEFAGGVSLKSKFEQSSVAPEVSGVGVQDPIIRQSVLEETTSLPLGKESVLGAVDVPGSTRHLDVEVMVELVK